MFIFSAPSSCSRDSKSFRRIASASSTVRQISSKTRIGMPAGLKYVTSGTKATRRHLTGLGKV